LRAPLGGVEPVLNAPIRGEQLLVRVEFDAGEDGVRLQREVALGVAGIQLGRAAVERELFILAMREVFQARSMTVARPRDVAVRGFVEQIFRRPCGRVGFARASELMAYAE